VFDKRVSFEVDPAYKINEVIGRGVYGVVAEGENSQTGQKVAVKWIK
jgi:serine/threonine protein kinase